MSYRDHRSFPEIHYTFSCEKAVGHFGFDSDGVGDLCDPRGCVCSGTNPDTNCGANPDLYPGLCAERDHDQRKRPARRANHHLRGCGGGYRGLFALGDDRAHPDGADPPHFHEAVMIQPLLNVLLVGFSVVIVVGGVIAASVVFNEIRG